MNEWLGSQVSRIVLTEHIDLRIVVRLWYVSDFCALLGNIAKEFYVEIMI